MVIQQQTEEEKRRQAFWSARPKLTAEDVGEYLDWITANLSRFSPSEVQAHMHACELVIRTRATDAQAKATQHTLVESGVIKAPPIA